MRRKLTYPDGSGRFCWTTSTKRYHLLGVGSGQVVSIMHTDRLWAANLRRKQMDMNCTAIVDCPPPPTMCAACGFELTRGHNCNAY